MIIHLIYKANGINSNKSTTTQWELTTPCKTRIITDLAHHRLTGKHTRPQQRHVFARRATNPARRCRNRRASSPTCPAGFSCDDGIFSEKEKQTGSGVFNYASDYGCKVMHKINCKLLYSTAEEGEMGKIRFTSSSSAQGKLRFEHT